MEVSFLEAFRNGLKPYEETRINGQYLVSCRNKLPSPKGLITPEPITQTFESKAIQWPFPQVARLKQHTWLFDKTEIYSVNEASSWALTLAQTYNFTSPSNTIAIVGSTNKWHIADFGDAWWATNGVSTVAKTKISGTWKLLSQTAPSVQTVSSAHNRLWVGGISGARTSASRFTNLVDYWMKMSPNQEVTWEDLVIDSNVLLYGPIGGGEVYYPFMDIMAILGWPGNTEFDALQATLYQDIEEGRIGFFLPEYPGATLGIAPLGENVVVLGENGISLLAYNGSTYQTAWTLRVGLLHRGCFASDGVRLWFVDRLHQLWLIDRDGPRMLDYRWLIEPLTNAEINLFYDDNQRHLYLCTSTKGYVLTDSGMGEVTEIPTSIISSLDTLVGRYVDLFDTAVSVEVEPFDFGNRQVKTIQDVVVPYRGATAPSVTLRSRLDSVGTNISHGPTTVDARGIAPLVQSGVEFSILLESSNFEQTDVSNLIVNSRGDDALSVKEILNA